MSVVRGAPAAVWQVLDVEPDRKSCMVAARVADPWHRSQCDWRELDRRGTCSPQYVRRCQPHPAARRTDRPGAFADVAMKHDGVRRSAGPTWCLPMWQRLEPVVRRGMCDNQPLMAWRTHTPAALSTPALHRYGPRNWTPTWWPPSTCSSGEVGVDPRLLETVVAAIARWLASAGRAWADSSTVRSDLQGQ